MFRAVTRLPKRGRKKKRDDEDEDVSSNQVRNMVAAAGSCVSSAQYKLEKKKRRFCNSLDQYDKHVLVAETAHKHLVKCAVCGENSHKKCIICGV